MNMYSFSRWVLNGQRLTSLLAAPVVCVAMLVSGASIQAREESATETWAVAEAAAIDINSADATQLAEALNGIGQSRAEAIVRYREEFGPFESVEELSEVQGIGSSTVERNRALIRLR
jgi:competence protein ComEA